MIIEMTGVTNSSAFQKLEDESNVLSSDHRNLSTEHTEDTELYTSIGRMITKIFKSNLD